MKNSWRGGESGDLAGAKSRGPFAAAAHLYDRHVFVRFQSKMFEKHPRDHVRRTADAADADAFATQLLLGLDRLLHDQLIGQCIHKTGGDQIRAADRSAGDGAAGAVAEFELTRDENGDIGGRSRIKIDSTSMPYFL